MKTVRTKAIVLRRTNYGEADRIVQFITPDGRRAVMAKGVRKEKSKLAGGIELFAVSDVVIGEGRGELGILTSAKLESFYRNILKDYERLQLGYQAVSLVAAASETVDEPEWFELLKSTLVGLDASAVPLSLVRAWFFIHYSALLGYELNVQRDIDGVVLERETRYRYDPLERGFKKDSAGDIDANHIKLLRLIASKNLPVLAQIGGIDEHIGLCDYVAQQHASVK